MEINNNINDSHDVQLKIIKSLQVVNNRMIVFSASCLLFACFMGLGWYFTIQKFDIDEHVTTVKLDPSGEWYINKNLDNSLDFFESTVNSILYKYGRRRYSKVKASIVEDWAIASRMQNNHLYNHFINELLDDKGKPSGAFVVAANHLSCSSCQDSHIKVNDHTHVTPVPETSDFGRELYKTILQVDIEERDSYGKRTNAPVRKAIIYLNWRFMPKSQLRKYNEMLEHNPIGIIIEHEEISYND